MNSTFSVITLAFTSGTLPDITGQVSSGSLVARVEEYLLCRTTLHKLSHPKKNHVVGNSPCLAQNVGNHYNGCLLLEGL